MKETFAGRIRAEVRKAFGNGEELGTEDLSELMGLQSYRDRRKLRDALRDFVERGEMERIRPGAYRYLGRGSGKPTKEYLMWRRLRKGASTVKDLMIFSGAGEDYVREWLGSLQDRKIVAEDAGGAYRLTKDSVEMPKNERKAERLRDLRERQKEIKAALGEARAAVDRAIQLADELEEGESECL